MKAVVMGGTAGVGLAAAERLTADGVDVTVTGRDANRLQEVAARVSEARQLDGTAYDEVGAFFDAFGEFEHLVLAFSPGAVGAGPLDGLEIGDVRAAVEGKLLPYLFAMKRARVTGSVTLISAASARAAMPGTLGLAAVNGAIERLVPPAAAELAPVRVNAVAPGVVDTAWWSFLDEGARAEQFRDFAASVPAQRVGTAQDVAEAVRYLTQASFVTGSVLAVDGGMTVA